MRSTIVAASLFAGAAFALPAPAETQTVYDTEVYTITSCGSEVTNCPARTQTRSVPVSVSTPAAASITGWGPGGWGPPGGGSWGSESWSSSSVLSTTSAVMSTTSAPITTSPATASTASVSVSIPVTVSTSPVAPVSSSSAWTSSVPVVPVGTAPASSPVSPVGTSPAAPWPISSSVATMPYYPTGTGSSWTTKPSGYASGTGSMPKNTTVPAPYTGSASGLKVAGGLVGAGAFVALFL